MPEPKYIGSSGALRVLGAASHGTDSFSATPVGPDEEKPTYDGQSQSIFAHPNSPDQWHDETLTGPLHGNIEYRGRSQAIHVFGTGGETWPPQDPIPGCKCCEEQGACGFTESFGPPELETSWPTPWYDTPGAAGTEYVYEWEPGMWVGELQTTSAGASQGQRYDIAMTSPVLVGVYFVTNRDAGSMIHPGGLASNTRVLAGINVSKTSSPAKSSSVSVVHRIGSGIGNGTDPVTQLEFFHNDPSEFEHIDLPITILTNTWYYLEFEVRNGLPLRARVYQEGGGVAAWIESTLDGTSDVWEHVSLSMKSQNLTTAQQFATFKQLTVSCGGSGGALGDCTDCEGAGADGIETFAHTQGINNWGTSEFPTSPAWSQGGPGSSTQTIAGGLGSIRQGQIDAAGDGLVDITYGTGQSRAQVGSTGVDTYPWSGDFTLSTRFKYKTLPDLGLYFTQGAIAIRNPNFTGFTFDLGMIWQHDSPTSYFGVVAGDSATGDRGSDTIAWSWAAGVWYLAKMERLGNTVRAKIWIEGNTEPDWQVSRNYVTYFLGDQLRVGTTTPGLGFVGETTSEMELEFDYIDVDTCNSECPECEDPANPGFQIPDFTPGYLPIFRRQIGDPTTTLDSYICTLESAAMVLDWHTRGAVQVWGGQLIPYCGKTEAEIIGVGTNLGNAKQAWSSGWGQQLSIRSGGTWSDLMACLAEGRAVILQGDYGVFTLAERCQDNFVDNHAISVYPYQTADRLLVGDPICLNFKGFKISSLQDYAETLGAAVFGVTSPQRILFAVSRPWVP